MDNFYDSFLILSALSDDCPDSLSLFCKEEAKKLGVTEEYFILEFLV